MLLPESIAQHRDKPMDSFVTEQVLHDRASRGETLTVAERAQLEAWYAKLDAAEQAQLAVRDSDMFANHKAIQQQIDATIIRIQIVTAEIQITTAENERLRAEVVALGSRLSDSSKNGE